MNVAAKLVRNSVFSAAARLWTAATTFFILPYMLQRMGDDAFGVYQLLVMLITYFMYVDAGLTTALPKYISEYAARDDREALTDVVNTGIAFYGIMALIGAVLSFLLTESYIHLIKTPEALIPTAVISFYWIIAVTGITFASLAFKGILVGLQRIDLINVVEVAVSIPILVATIVVLVAGKGLLGMAIVQFAQYTMIGAATVVLAVRSLPAIRINPFRASLATFKRLFGFAPTALPAFALIFQGQAERLLLANLLGPGAVGLYTFGAKVVDVLKVTFYPGLSAIVPAASHLDAIDAAESVRALYDRGTKYMLTVISPVTAWLFAITPVFIAAWMGGGGHGYTMGAMRLLLIGATIQLASGVALSVVRGLGRMKPDLIASPIFVLTELVAGIVMGRIWGFHGILIAGTLAFLANSLVSLHLVHSSFRWPLGPALVKLYLPPLFVSGIAAAPVYWYNHITKARIIAHDSVAHRAELCGIGAVETVVFVAVYVVLIRLVRYISQDEMQSLMRAARGLGRLKG